MADPINPTSTLLQEQPPHVEQDKVLEQVGKPSAVETAAAIWRRDTVIGSALAEIGLGDDPAVAEYDSKFNPYAEFQKRKDELQDLEPWVRKGAFDRVRNEADFNRTAARIRAQMDDLQLISAGSGWGLALGTGLSLLDVATLIPGAGGTKAGVSAVRNAFRVGAEAAALQGVQEGVLHQMEPTRSDEESFFNIGTAAPLGAGIGVFASVLHPKSPLNPKNNPPLTGTENHPIASAMPGMTPGEAEVIGSVGAARAGVQSGIEATTGEGVLGKAAVKLGQVLAKITPTGRATLWSSQVGRDKAVRMFDLGGIFTRHMDEGVAQHAAAEDIYRDHLLALHEINQDLVDGFRQMQMDLGTSGSIGAATVKSDVNLLGSIVGKKKLLNTGISEDEFQEIVRRKVTNSWWQQGADWKNSDVDGKYFSDLMQDAGIDDKGAKVIDAATDKIAKVIQQKSLDQEEKMFRAGMITEKQRLGVRYGLAQLWDRKTAQMNKDELRGKLLEVFRKRPDEAWLQERGLTLEDWKALPDRATKSTSPDGKPVETPGRLDLLEEWVGDDAAVGLERAKAAYDAAESAYRDALSVHDWTQLGVKAGREDATHFKMGELKASIRAKEAQNALDRLEVYEGRVRTLEDRVEKLRAKVVAGRSIEGGAGSRVIEGFEAVQRLGGLVDEAAARENVQAAENLSRLYEKAVEDLTVARARLADHMKRIGVQDPQKVEAAVKRARDSKLESEGRLAERERAIDEQEARVKTLTDRLEEVSRKRAEALETYKQLREGAKKAGVDARLARKDLNAAKRELAKQEKRGAILDTVDEIVDSIADHGKAPNGLLRDVGQSGRAKDRRIILTNEERRLFEDAGFLHKDLQYVLDKQYRDISARLALRESFGEEGLTKTFKEIDADYDKLIKANPAKAEKVKVEREKLKADLTMGRDRLLGVAGRPDDPESLALWGLNKLRQMTYFRFAAGFPLSNLMDLSTQVLHNGFGKDSHAAAQRFVHVLKTGKVDPASRELRTLVLAAEMSMAHSTASRQFGLNEMDIARGVGIPGSLKKKITSAIDRPFNTLQSRMNAWTLMGPYNAFVKAVSGLMMVEKLSTKLGKYEKLSRLEKTELASLGIGAEEAAQLAKYFEKYGTRDEYGFHANSFNWTQEKGGDEAARILRIAINRHINRSSPTPGIGDAPLFMSRPMGQVLLQFQSYGFGAVNRVLLPALQRGLVYGDARTLGWMGSLVGLATLVATIRAYQNGKDPADYTSQQWMREVVDRGGLTFYLSPYVDAVDKATGIPFGGGGLSSRYRNNKWWQSLLGPAFGTMDTIGTAGTSLINGDFTRAREKGFLLLPFNQVWRLGNAIANPPN